ncbi:MAG: MFS transporter [Arenimonas sp.]|uniref:MFS transporter n=1 Tax=Arenimonas sp. TaxID=1872635 RepID=UPI0025C2FE9E|nr:MFS transporter [Arenimonas sp.]MBW8368625.1 MFS transporter [Arenimonas sp.]
MDASLRRFSLFYFFYYAALGAYTPYIGRWVDGLGHSGYVVGAMLGLWYGSRIVSPPVWAALSGRSARPGEWFVGGCALTLLCFAGFLFTQSAWALLGVMAAFGLFYNAVMPQFEAMTLTALGPRTDLYGRLRVWGSIGFLLVASSYGALMDHFGDRAFPWLTLPLFAAMLVAAWPHRHDTPPAHVDTVEDAGHLWKRPGVRRFLLMALLMQVGFGPFYVFYTLHMQAAGHSGAAIGMLWAIGVLIEIAMFWQAPKLIGRFGASRLLMVCMAVTVVRWTVTALFAHSLPVMMLAASTHALSFAVFHACVMRQMSTFFPGKRAAAGQSLLYGFSSGVGGVLGAGMAALAWESAGGGRLAFLLGAAVTVVAWVVYALRRQTPLRARQS